MKRLLVILAVVVSTSASARIISYAPYTDRTALPVQQNRLNRYFVLLETPTASSVPPPGPVILPPPGGCCYQVGQLVLYDSKGESEPRVIFPTDGSLTGFSAVAVRETGGTPVILIQTTNNMSAAPTTTLIWMLSTDGGKSWKTVPLPQVAVQQTQYVAPDTGGPILRDRYSPVRIGTDAYPFVVSLTYTTGIYAISAAGAPRLIVAPPNPVDNLSLIGSDSSGSLFLVRIGNMLYVYELNGIRREIGPLTPNSTAEGWITPTGAYVYVDERTSEGATLWFYGGGMRGAIISGPSRSDFLYGLIDIPAFDYASAWIITRGTSIPTVLYRHTPTGGLVKQWEDVTAPQVEALHAGRSGKSLLVQVNRPRPQPDQRMFIDPALAVWHIGEPAPRAYDELFMNEQPSKGFVHLDVDAAERGEPFVFDSGPQYYGPGLIISPAPPMAGGGSDVVQEWGVVRASLAQHLVLPSVGRTPGAFGSYWMTDVLVYNPLAGPQDVTLRFVSSGASPEIQTLHQKTLTLASREIRRLPDVLSTVFEMTSGNGALFITPASAVNVTSRTYTTSQTGTYGFGMNGIDIFTAAGPRFPLTYSGAFQGKDFRTNLVLADVSGRGSATHASVVATDGTVLNGDNVVLSAPANGQQQFNLISESLTFSPNATGALVLQPERGELIGSVMVIDNKTNDPTFFPPDLPASTVRTIPAIGHLDGANGSKFRTDLFLFNPSSTPRPVTIQVKAWDSPDVTTVQLMLLGNESRVIRDALFRGFGKTGIARLRFVSTADNTGVRMTARTYNINDDGGTYGYLMPAVNNFQIAAPGDTLEILGVVGGERFRTNIGLVELTGLANGQNASAKVEIIDDKGATIDTLTVNMPVAGGMQLNDIFHARGLGDGPPAALIRVTALAGTFAAYATTIDNGTNDPVYLAANLAAQE